MASASSPRNGNLGGASAGGFVDEAGLKEKKQARAAWLRVFQGALDADTWGQSIEATEQYQKLQRMLEAQVAQLPSLSQDEKTTCMKIAHTVTLRMHTLLGEEAALNDQSGARVATQKLTLEEVRAVQPVLRDLFEKAAPAAFPIELQNYSAVAAAPTAADSAATAGGTHAVFGIAHDDQLEKDNGERGSLLPAPKVRAGLTTLSVAIEKIGLKDAQTYLDAFITVSVADSNGNVIESQDTPRSNILRPNYVDFGRVVVHIQTPLEEIAARDLCLFFEFKHYKPAKKKISTRCYALMEPKEIDLARGQQTPGGAVCLELYKKPTDLTRKKTPSLFTIKQLYLHLALTFAQH